MTKSSTIICVLLLFFICSTAEGQKFKKENLQPKVVNGKFLNSAEVLFQNGLTSILEQIWVPNNWEDESRTQFEYDNSERLSRMLSEEFVNSAWVVQGDVIFEYSAQGQLEVHIMKYYSEGVVEFGTKWEYTYSGESINEVIRSEWDVDGNIWEIDLKQVYEYSDGLVSKILEYDYIMSSWDVSYEYTFQYNAQGLEIEELTRLWSESNNIFENDNISNTTYDGNGNILEIISKSWNVDTQNWDEDNYYLWEYEYDGNSNCTIATYTFAMKFGDFVMLTKSKEESEYDSNNYLVTKIDFTWEDFSSQWVELTKYDYTNDEAGNIQEVLLSSNLSGTWEAYEKHIYTYDGTVPVEEELQLPNNLTLQQNYPNPFNPTTEIMYSIAKHGNVEINVYDMLGNYISTLTNSIHTPGNYIVSFDASELSSGIYIYSLKSSNYLLTKKCLLLK